MSLCRFLEAFATPANSTEVVVLCGSGVKFILGRSVLSKIRYVYFTNMCLVDSDGASQYLTRSGNQYYMYLPEYKINNWIEEFGGFAGVETSFESRDSEQPEEN